MGRGSVFWGVVVTVALVAPVAAQEAPPDAEAEAARTREVAQRVAREIACLRGKQQELERVLRLISEAQTQMSSPRADERARADAREAVRSLSQRAVEVERSIAQCREPLSARARSGEPVQGVIVRRVEPGPREASVGTASPSIRTVEGAGVLHGAAGVVAGEQVDGLGQLPPAVVRGAVRSIGDMLDRCYDRLVGEGSLRRGTIELSFRVAPGGRVYDIGTHASSFPSSFDQCVRGAATGMRFSQGPVGGDAVYSYTLRFPAE